MHNSRTQYALKDRRPAIFDSKLQTARSVPLGLLGALSGGGRKSDRLISLLSARLSDVRRPHRNDAPTACRTANAWSQPCAL